VNGDAALEGLKSAVVVMVDDEPTTLEVLEMFLQGEGYRELVKITDPRKAFEQIADLEPDVVLLNLMMPHVSGLEILAAMQAHTSLRTIPVLIITGSSDPDVKRRALEFGAADFLGKPIDPSELSLRLRNTLAARAYREGGVLERRSAAAPTLQPSPTPQADEGRIRTIVDTFRERLQPRLDVMEASLQQGDFAGLAALAHWLKGAAGTVGLHEFTAPAEVLGRLARQQRPKEISALIAQLRSLAEATGSAQADRGD